MISCIIARLAVIWPHAIFYRRANMTCTKMDSRFSTELTSTQVSILYIIKSNIVIVQKRNNGTLSAVYMYIGLESMYVSVYDYNTKAIATIT
jgi:hypothetical protein